MPPLDVSAHGGWEAIRTLAVVVGIREAARRLGLPEEAVKRRATRERWLDQCKPVPALSPLPESMRPRVVSPVSPNGQNSVQKTTGDVLLEEMQTLGKQTRIGLAKGLAKGAAHISTLEGEEILSQSQEIGHVTRAASQVHGWSDERAGGQLPAISIHLIGSELVERRVDAVEIEPGGDAQSSKG